MSYLDDANVEQGGTPSESPNRRIAHLVGMLELLWHRVTGYHNAYIRAGGEAQPDDTPADPVDLLMMRIRPGVNEGYGAAYKARLETLAADPEILGLLRSCSDTQDAAVTAYWCHQMRQCVHATIRGAP